MTDIIRNKILLRIGERLSNLRSQIHNSQSPGKEIEGELTSGLKALRQINKTNPENLDIQKCLIETDNLLEMFKTKASLILK